MYRLKKISGKKKYKKINIKGNWYIPYEKRNWELFSIYRKFELMIYRLYKIAKFLEFKKRFTISVNDTPKSILDPKGFKSSVINIPFNAFYLKKEHELIWKRIYPKLAFEDTDRSIHECLLECWRRIHEIKSFVGASKNTRTRGENKRHRLVYILTKFVKTGVFSDYFKFSKYIFSVVSREEVDNFLRKVMFNKKKSGITCVS